MGSPNNDPYFYLCTHCGRATVVPNGKKDVQGRKLFQCPVCKHVTSDELLMRASGKRRIRD
jgi:hypothetical protein